MACKTAMLLFSRQFSKQISVAYLSVPKTLFRAIGVRFYSQNTDLKSQETTIERVYTAELSNKLKRVKIFSLTTSAFGIVAQPFLYQALASANNMPVLIFGCTFMGFFTFLTPVLLHLVARKYIISIDYNEEKKTYITTAYNFFCIPKQVEFTPDDVVKPDIDRMFTTCFVKGKPIFVDERLFEKPYHYARIMGYDKPFNLDLYDVVKQKKNE